MMIMILGVIEKFIVENLANDLVIVSRDMNDWPKLICLCV